MNDPLDFHHLPTLAITMAHAFAVEAKKHGVRLEGIEEDANEWNDFFVKVAQAMLNG